MKHLVTGIVPISHLSFPTKYLLHFVDISNIINSLHRLSLPLDKLLVWLYICIKNKVIGSHESMRGEPGDISGNN